MEPGFLKWGSWGGVVGLWAGLGGGRSFEFCDWIGFCDWHLVLGWVGLEIDGLGGSTPAMKSNFYLFPS